VAGLKAAPRAPAVRVDSGLVDFDRDDGGLLSLDIVGYYRDASCCTLVNVNADRTDGRTDRPTAYNHLRYQYARALWTVVLTGTEREYTVNLSKVGVLGLFIESAYD